MEKQKVVTRFAPSPTGFMHMGSVRTALFAYLFARHNHGKFILRIEDTDRERSKKEFDDGIVDSMKWLGLSYDESFRQSERKEIYKKYLQKLLDSKQAYWASKENEEIVISLRKRQIEGEKNRDSVIRFNNPGKTVIFTDLIRGEIAFDTTELGDFVIAKSLDEPVFHLAVAVDDYEMGITHVIRGEDHISNTPRHVLICEAMEAPCPLFAHLPLVLAPDRTKLSKRKHGEAVSLDYYRKRGFLPEAIINFMALIGWNPGNDEEIFSLEDLVKIFDMAKVQKGGAVFNIEKLNWFNKYYMQKLSPQKKIAFLEGLVSPPQFQRLAAKPGLIEVMSERADTFGELSQLIKEGEYDYFFGKPAYDKKLLFWKGKEDSAKTKIRLAEVRKLLENIPEASFNRLSIKDVLWPYAEKEGRGEVLWPLRVCLSGKEKSPDPFVLGEMLGREESLARVAEALNLLS